MAEVVLDQPGVRALVGQGVAAGVAAALGGRQEPVDFRRHQIVAFEHRTVYC
mgnify:CR=1 FL=1